MFADSSVGPEGGCPIDRLGRARQHLILSLVPRALTFLRPARFHALDLACALILLFDGDVSIVGPPRLLFQELVGRLIRLSSLCALTFMYSLEK